ncbi:MAG: hypothetical protein IPN03_24160 [Holophagales bacterium]|nr:hypothetical protein [Holophagales bacterium]
MPRLKGWFCFAAAWTLWSVASDETMSSGWPVISARTRGENAHPIWSSCFASAGAA